MKRISRALAVNLIRSGADVWVDCGVVGWAVAVTPKNNVELIRKRRDGKGPALCGGNPIELCAFYLPA